MSKIINVFGDSIAWGAFDSEGGWVDRLKKYLMKDSSSYSEVYNLGISGDSTRELIEMIDIENKFRNPNVIIVAMGANDACYVKSINENYIVLGDFEKNLLTTIEKAKKFTNDILFIGLTNVDELKVSPVPWAEDLYYNKKNIKIYNDKIKEVCANNKIHFIEMLDLLDKNDLLDGLHPNSEGHEKMFLRIKNYLEENRIIS